MSGFWDALTRTALGLAGTAQPRPRSLFEPDEGAAPDLVEQETVIAASAHDAQDPPLAETLPAAPVASASDPVDRLSSPAPERDDPGAVTAAPPQRDEPDVREIAAQPIMPAAAERVVERERLVERVEVSRVESRHVIAEAVAPPALERPEATAVRVDAVPARAAGDAAEDGRAVPESGHDREPASTVVLVAEPAGAPVPGLAMPEAPVSAAPPLVIEIEIERIDIRIESETPVVPVPARRRDSDPVPSLSDYLQRRSEARR